MHITLTPELEVALREQATRRGVPAEELALESLRERFLRRTPPEPRDEWERKLFSIAIDCGVSLSNEALGRESLYE